LSSSTPSRSFHLARFCPCWAHWGGQSCPQPPFSPTSGGAGLNILWLAECAVIENKDLGCQPQARRPEPAKSRLRPRLAAPQ
jgi:hypothetical protein